MTLEKPSRQNIHEIAAVRFNTMVAGGNLAVTLKLSPDAGVQGFVVGFKGGSTRQLLEMMPVLMA